MTDHGIITIWANDVTETREIFKYEFNKISERDDNHGLYTFFICSYVDYKMTIEVVYALVYEHTCFFAYSNKMFVVQVNEKLEITNSKFVSDANSHFLSSLYFNETNDLVYICDLVDSVGNLFPIFTIPYKKPKKILENMIERDQIDLEGIYIDESHFLDIAVEYNNYIIDEFQNKIENAIKSEDAYEGMDSNPFANQFYDRGLINAKTQMVNNPVRISK